MTDRVRCPKCKSKVFRILQLPTGSVAVFCNKCDMKILDVMTHPPVPIVPAVAPTEGTKDEIQRPVEATP